MRLLLSSCGRSLRLVLFNNWILDSRKDKANVLYTEKDETC